MPKALTKEDKFLLASQTTPRALRAAGWTPRALRAAGLTPSDLRAAGWTPSELIAAGLTPSDLIAAGWTPSDLIAAGWTPRALRAAGWTPSALIAAGWTPSDLRAAGWTDDLLADIPLLEKPYTNLLADIQTKKRIHRQSTFGPEECVPERNVCGTPMCTAGHLVQMAGERGYELKKQYGWAGAANLLHYKAHPESPAQNFGTIPQDWAMAYIETMAEKEVQ